MSSGSFRSVEAILPPRRPPRACAGCRRSRPDPRRPGRSRSPILPSSFTSCGDLGAGSARRAARARHQRRRHAEWASWTSETSRPSATRARRTPISMSSFNLRDVARAHRLADERALLRPPERVLDEGRQQPVGGVDERRASSSCPRACSSTFSYAIPAPWWMPSSVVSRLQTSSSTVPREAAGDQSEARDDQALVEDLHLEDLLLERVGLERHVRELVEVRVALGRAAGLLDQLQPRLGVARLVLHHRRVVELRLGVGRDVQELRTPSRRRACPPAAAA